MWLPRPGHTSLKRFLKRQILRVPAEVFRAEVWVHGLARE